MTIGYIAQVFPSLTMTFVYREVRALRGRGLDVQTFSTWKPALSDLSEEAKALVADTFYIFPLNWVEFALSHAWFLLTRPRRYLSTLWFCVTRKHKTPKNRLRTLGHFFQAVRLAREIKRKNVTHLHAHFALNAATIAMIVTRLTETTFSFTAHANDLFANPILLPEKIQAARFIIAISEYNVRFMHRLVPTQETSRKMHLVHCGIDVQWFAPRTSAAPGRRFPSGGQASEEPKPAATLGIAEAQDCLAERPIILAVGRLVEKKGYPYLIEACRILASRGYDFRCLIVGGGPQEPLLRKLIGQGSPADASSAENDLSESVKMVGRVFQQDLLDYLEQADVFCLPCVVASDGDMDGIPNTLMEAMAMEIPTVSTTISGIPELIQDGRTGLLVPPKDAVALAEAIAALLDNGELGYALGKAGRIQVMEEFEIGNNVDRLVDIFAACIGDSTEP